VAHALDNVLLPALGERPYDAITTGELVDFYVDLEERYEPSTVRRYHGMISKLYGDLERLEELPLTRNPVRRLPEVPGGIAPKRSVPTPAEFARIVEAATDYSPAYATYLLLAAASGIRRGSMLALRWRDVDVAAGVVTVYQAVSVDETGEVFLRGTKSGSSFPVAILGRALDALREHRRRAAETALALGLAGGFDDLYVFSADGGRSHWSVSHPSHAFAKCARRVDLGRFRLHDVRHFAASVMLRGRVPVAVVAERLGCTEANVHRTYSHHFPTDGDTRAAEAMAAVL
jgi:integrase